MRRHGFLIGLLASICVFSQGSIFAMPLCTDQDDQNLEHYTVKAYGYKITSDFTLSPGMLWAQTQRTVDSLEYVRTCKEAMLGGGAEFWHFYNDQTGREMLIIVRPDGDGYMRVSTIWVKDEERYYY